MYDSKTARVPKRVCRFCKTVTIINRSRTLRKTISSSNHVNESFVIISVADNEMMEGQCDVLRIRTDLFPSSAMSAMDQI